MTDNNWTDEEKLYNDQCNFVEYFWNDHPEAFRAALDEKTLKKVLYYFGVDEKYGDNVNFTEENFLLRRKRILAEDAAIQNEAASAMIKVTHQLKAETAYYLFA